MRKLSVLGIGLVLAVAACAPFPATNQGTESAAPTATTATTATTDTPEATATPTAPTLTEADIIAPTPSGKSLQPELGQASIDLSQVVTLLPPDAIPAILPDRAGEILVTAAEAEAIGIGDDVQVIGVSIDGDHRAYPIPFLSRHEIVNDEIGGRPLAVTW